MMLEKGGGRSGASTVDPRGNKGVRKSEISVTLKPSAYLEI